MQKYVYINDYSLIFILLYLIFIINLLIFEIFLILKKERERFLKK